ncbi:Predicted permease YjgP/YjgQ family [hydrothermal vent metagenome]|uniref:Predicted permease YjgP/YjgQ family n=1 Tax=hydrothermal vent metagenome TaxID=652676 RepID=A0A1W1BPL3_9ZZZZ
MHELKKYIIKNISFLFFSIFAPLWVIASVIILIKLATYTAVIHLSVWEMFKLYLFLLPEILFYTLPVTFFIAVSIALYRLSADNEIISLFALGITPNFLLRTLAKPAFLLSLLLAFDFLILFPHTSVLYRNFIAYKKSEAKFNLSASEFGHSFGDWLLYIGKKNADGTYGDIFLFNKKKSQEVLINAKKAKIDNKNSILKLQLTNGEGYSYSKEKFIQTEFQTMYINDMMRTDLTRYETPLEFWQSNYRRGNKDRKLILGTMFSLFPLASLFLALTLGIVHTRHQRSYLYLYLFVGIILYFISTLALQKPLHFMTIPTVLIPWIIITFWLYKRKILKRF